MHTFVHMYYMCTYIRELEHARRLTHAWHALQRHVKIHIKVYKEIFYGSTQNTEI